MRIRSVFVSLVMLCCAAAAHAAPAPARGRDAGWWPEGRVPPYVADVRVDSADPRAILLSNARFVVAAGSKLDDAAAPAAVPAALRGDAPAAGGWLIVQFAPGLNADERNALLGRHHALPGDLVPNEAQLARVPAADVAALADEPRVAWIGRFHPAYKLSPALGATRPGAVATGATPEPWRVDLALAPDADAAAVADALRREDGATVVGTAPGRVRLSFADGALLARLAHRDDVLFVHETPQPRLLNNDVRWILQSGVPGVYSIHAHQVRGASQVVAVMDDGFQTSHCCFTAPGKVKSVKAWGSGTLGAEGDPSHGTHVAGTLGCKNGGDHDGMAPDSPIVMQDIGNVAGYIDPPLPLTGAWDDARAAGARIHTNSWGSSSNAYDSDDVDIDRYTWTNQDFLILYAAGNDGPDTGWLNSYANAKNSIGVGATENGAANNDMASFSSPGPAADGRIAPDLTAPGDPVSSAYNLTACGWIGDSGTSMATPAVAGAAALVRDYFVQGFYPLGTANAAFASPPSAALVKATLLVSTRDMTGAYAGGHRPNSNQGFGRVTLDDALWFAGDPADQRLVILDDRNTATGFTAAGAFDQFTVHLTQPGPFKALLVWSDAPGGLARARQLVDDLDLDVTTPDGKHYAGNQGFANGSTASESTNHDRLNNKEAVFLDSVPAGDVTVTVTAFAVPGASAAHPQDYALVVLAPAIPPCSAPAATGVGNSVTHVRAGSNLVATWADRGADHYVVYRGNVPSFYGGGVPPYVDNVHDGDATKPGVQWTDAGAIADGQNHYYLYSSANACGDAVP